MYRIGLIGDRDETVTAHRAIPRAVQLASQETGIAAGSVWIGTDTIGEATEERLATFDALWCVPGSPYRDRAGALAAIRFARERGLPFLGTCGGFQHALLEHARNVAGWDEAGNAEEDPRTKLPLIAPLSCALVEQAAAITLVEGTTLHALHGVDRVREEYHCSYGLNPAFASLLEGPGLRVSGLDDRGAVRAFERTDHPFFVCTLFQPERAALRGTAPRVAVGLLRAAATARPR
jgi:CTP synthase (UTP-ammonia lyase)